MSGSFMNLQLAVTAYCQLQIIKQKCVLLLTHPRTYFFSPFIGPLKGIRTPAFTIIPLVLPTSMSVMFFWRLVSDHSYFASTNKNPMSAPRPANAPQFGELQSFLLKPFASVKKKAEPPAKPLRPKSDFSLPIKCAPSVTGTYTPLISYFTSLKWVPSWANFVLLRK